MTSGFLRRFSLFKIYLVIATVAIFVLTFFAKQYAFFPFDLYITKSIQLIEFYPFERLMLLLSWAGNVYQTIFSLAIGGGLFLYWKRKDLAVGLLGSAIGAVVISETLKLIVSRPRPDANLIHQIERFTRDDSFPSGHVLYYIGFYGFLLFISFTLISNKFWRNIFSAFFLSLIILIGVSRIYIGSHWFSDTLGSYLIGSIWLYIVVLLFRKYDVRLKKDAK